MRATACCPVKRGGLREKIKSWHHTAGKLYKNQTRTVNTESKIVDLRECDMMWSNLESMEWMCKVLWFWTWVWDESEYEDWLTVDCRDQRGAKLWWDNQAMMRSLQEQNHYQHRNSTTSDTEGQRGAKLWWGNQARIRTLDRFDKDNHTHTNRLEFPSPFPQGGRWFWGTRVHTMTWWGKLGHNQHSLNTNIHLTHAHQMGLIEPRALWAC